MTFRKPPSNIKSLLGLNLKFIPRPKFTTHDLDDTITQFRQQVYIQDFYQNNPVDNRNEELPLHIPKLHIPNTLDSINLENFGINNSSHKRISPLHKKTIFQKKMHSKSFIVTTAYFKSTTQKRTLCHHESRQKLRSLYSRNRDIHKICFKGSSTLQKHIQKTFKVICIYPYGQRQKNS